MNSSQPPSPQRPARGLPPPIPVRAIQTTRSSRTRRWLRYKWEFFREEVAIHWRIVPPAVIVLLYVLLRLALVALRVMARARR